MMTRWMADGAADSCVARCCRKVVNGEMLASESVKSRLCCFETGMNFSCAIEGSVRRLLKSKS